MGKMQVPVHQEIRVVAMGHGFVAAIRTVDMRCLVTLTHMRRRTDVRVLRGNRQDVFVDVIFMWMVHVSVVQKVYMVVMLNPGMAAGVIVFMDVWGVRGVTHRDLL